MNCFSFYLKVLILHCAGVWRICACTCADSRGLSGVCYLYLTVLDRVFHRDWVANKLLGDLPGSTMPGHVQAGDSSSGHHAYLASILTPWAISLNPFLHFFFFLEGQFFWMQCVQLTVFSFTGLHSSAKRVIVTLPSLLRSYWQLIATREGESFVCEGFPTGRSSMFLWEASCPCPCEQH